MTKQFALFLVVGFIQYALDVATFSLLVVVLSTEISNVLSRLLGAAIGYTLNGVITFRQSGQVVISPAGVLRFAVVWLSLTLVSTLSISYLVDGFADDWHSVVAVKLIIEAMLVVVSFFLQKFFVFKP